MEPNPYAIRTDAGPQDYPPVPITPIVQQRVGDAERSAVCEELAAQFAVGRLTGDELEERLEAAVAARTRWDLRLLLSDLPRANGPAPGPRPVPPPPPPGLPWTGLDALMVTILTCSAAILAVMTLAVAAGRSNLLVYVMFGGLLAVALGASAMHLIHRSWARSLLRSARTR